MNALLTRDEAILVANLNVRGKAACERPATHAAKLRSNKLAAKRWALSSSPNRASREPEGLVRKLSPRLGSTQRALIDVSAHATEPVVRDEVMYKHSAHAAV